MGRRLRCPFRTAMGMIASFHFYQLIEDKTTKDIHGDKLDIYAGLNVGSGIGFSASPGWVNALFFVGPQVGARYYRNPYDRFGWRDRLWQILHQRRRNIQTLGLRT